MRAFPPGTPQGVAQYEGPNRAVRRRCRPGPDTPQQVQAMDCQEFLRLHSEFLDERLAQADADRCAAHAAVCASCARYDRIVRRGQELLRRLPPAAVSPEFAVRLEARVQAAQHDVLAGRSTGAASGAVLSLAIAGLLALAAWGPMLQGDDEPAADRVAEAERAYAAPVAESLMRPAAPDWWQAPSLGTAFGGVRPREHIEMAFPGPYSPLIVMPPVAGRAGGALVPAHLTALE